MEESGFRQTLDWVAQALSSYYGAALPDPKSLLIDQLGGDLAKYQSCRAQLLFQEGPEELFIGLFFAPSIIKTLELNPPIKELSAKNLDAFWAVVEELSHLCLIAARLSSGQASTRLIELEFQAEIDKLLLGGLLLKEQLGHCELEFLARWLFEGSHILPGSQARLYEEASRYAARFWYDLWSYIPSSQRIEGPFMRGLLNGLHNSNWPQKLRLIERINRRLAAA